MQGADGDGTDSTTAQHSREPADVIHVQVRDDQQWYSNDVKPAQATVHRTGLRTAVHHHTGTRPGIEDQRIALPDVTDDHHPTLRRPAGQGSSDRQDDHRSHACRTQGQLPD